MCVTAGDFWKPVTLNFALEPKPTSVWCFFDLRSSIPDVPAVRLGQLPTYTGSPTGAGAQKLPTYSWVGVRGVSPRTVAASTLR